MKSNETKYETVTKLPKGAKTVAQYAADNNMKAQNVYNIFRRKGDDSPIRIVVFNTFNHVIENK